MIGLSGLLFRSASGAKLTWMPTARPSTAAAVAMVSASLGSPVAPTAMICGKAVAPTMRIPGPHSRSAETSNGSRARSWSALSFAAMSNGEPTEMMRPPTRSESTQRSATWKLESSNAAKLPASQGTMSWPIFSRGVSDASRESGDGGAVVAFAVVTTGAGPVGRMAVGLAQPSSRPRTRSLCARIM